jgi:hypothetical protein
VCALVSEAPLQPKVTFKSCLRTCRDNWDEYRAFADLAADLLVPNIPPAQLTLVEPELDTVGPECITNVLSCLRILRGVAQEYGPTEWVIQASPSGSDWGTFLWVPRTSAYTNLKVRSQGREAAAPGRSTADGQPELSQFGPGAVIHSDRLHFRKVAIESASRKQGMLRNRVAGHSGNFNSRLIAWTAARCAAGQGMGWFSASQGWTRAAARMTQAAQVPGVCRPTACRSRQP